MKIVWLSANKLGYESLKSILELKDTKIEIPYILTLNPDSKTVMYDGIPINNWFELGIPVYLIDRIETQGLEVLKKNKVDLVSMIGWRQIVPSSILNIPKEGFISIHPTLLPYGRGPAPIINQMLEGIKNTGITLLYTDEGTDSGDIIAQEKFIIECSDHASDVYRKIEESSVSVLTKYLPLIANNNAPRTPQDESKATIFSKPKNPNQINLQDSLDSTFRRIKALSKPYNGAYLTDNFNNKLIIWKAEITEKQPNGVRFTASMNLEQLLEYPTKLFFSNGTKFLKVNEGEIIKYGK